MLVAENQSKETATRSNTFELSLLSFKRCTRFSRNDKVHAGAHHLTAEENALTFTYTVQSFNPSGATMLLNHGSPEEL